MGLMEALRGYDPARGVTFATYAVPHIWGRMRHFVRDGARRMGRETLSAPDGEQDPDDPFERLHTRLDLEHALSRLTPDEAHLIRRRFEAGLDERPLAAELGLSQPTVSRRLKKALLHLHQQLTADHAQPKRPPDRH
jgi:RNA polymerase sigma factor (sigma-70 family)